MTVASDDERPAAMGETAEPAPALRPRCALSGRDLRRRDAVPVSSLRQELSELIRREHPELAEDAIVSRQEVARYRAILVEELLRAEKREVTDLEREVINSLEQHEMVADNVDDEFEVKRTFGERAADQVASFGGSWNFIISFGVVIVVWMVVNVGLGTRAFDEYPFILLNLVLSCLAAVQAPIIMMSQKRQDAKDRVRSLNDYQVNLKAELEIRHLHEKIDHLMMRQWERLAELQRMQIDLMQEALGRKRAIPPSEPQKGP